jgi:predicted N-acetyltransferase YhbS
MTNIEYKIARTKEEFEGIKDLCEDVFAIEEKELLHDLVFNSPNKEENICFYAYDKTANKYVGTVNLVVMPIRYGNVILKSAELGIVATAKDYQGRGINKKLMEIFFNKAEELGYNIIAIEGIPYFYRRYGFNYAIPMGSVNLNLDKVESKGDKDIVIRVAKEEDIAFIADNFREASKIADLCTVKGKGIIKAQMLDYISPVTRKKYLIIKKNQTKIGYLALNSGDEVQICDISDNLSFKIYEAVIDYFKGQGKSFINIDIPRESKFIKLMDRYGCNWKQWYSWQIKILDEFKFLTDIKSVLEERLNNSIYKDEQVEFYYDNFRELIKFEIDNGRINLIKEERKEAKWDFNLNPQGAIKLFLGEKSRSEINSFLPDCNVNHRYRDLINILFPRMNSHFYMNY